MSSKEDDEMVNTLLSSKEDDEMDKTLTHEEKKEIINEAMNKNNNNIIKRLNDDFDKIIDKSKSFEDQIKSIKRYKI